MITASTAASASRQDRADPPGPVRGPALLVLGGLVLAGMVLRFVTTSPLWLDEALSVNLAELPLGDLPEALRHDGHPGLYYVLLGGWVDLFGDGDTAVRSLSGIFSLLTIPVVWAATRHRFGPRVGGHAAVLAAASPFLIRYGTETRMYALMALLVAVGWWALDQARAQPTRWRLGVVAVITAALLHTHYWALWLLIGTGVVLMAEWWRGGPEQTSISRSLIGAIGVGTVTFVPWLPILFDQALHTGTPWAGRARPAEVAVETVEALGAGMRSESMLLGIVLVMTITVGVMAVGSESGVIRLGSRPPAATSGPTMIVALTLGGGGLVAFATAGAFEPRYVAVVMPLLIALAARGVTSLPATASTVALIALAGLGVAVAADDARRDRTQGEAAASLIDELAAPGDLVVFCPDQLAPATLRTLSHAGPVRTYPTTADPRFVDWYDYSDRITAQDASSFAADVDTTAGTGAVWLVAMTSYRGFEGRCEAISETLTARRDRQPILSPREVFEPMVVERFGERR